MPAWLPESLLWPASAGSYFTGARCPFATLQGTLAVYVAPSTVKTAVPSVLERPPQCPAVVTMPVVDAVSPGIRCSATKPATSGTTDAARKNGNATTSVTSVNRFRPRVIGPTLSARRHHDPLFTRTAGW